MATVDVRAAAVAVLGIATVDELVAAGISRRSIRRRVATEDWELLARGVVRLWAIEDPRQLLRAAVLSGPGGTLASHVTAARLHDIGGFDPPPRPHVTVPRGYRYLAPALATVHTTTRLVPVAETKDGVPVTPVPRTLRDLATATDVPRTMLHRAVRDALRTGKATVEELLAEAEPRGPGRRRLRAAAEQEAASADHAVDSRLERAWIDALLDDGIREFVTQHVLRDGTRTVRLDIAWPEARVALEVDGARFHADALATASDEARTQWLRARGWSVIRVTAADLRPDRRHLALAEIRTALTRAATAN